MRGGARRAPPRGPGEGEEEKPYFTNTARRRLVRLGLWGVSHGRSGQVPGYLSCHQHPASSTLYFLPRVLRRDVATGAPRDPGSPLQALWVGRDLKDR